VVRTLAIRAGLCKLYGCEVWPTETIDMRELDVIRNNGFRHILTAVGVKAQSRFSFFAILSHCHIS